MTSSAQCPEKAWILLSYNNFKFGGRSRHSIAMDPLSSNYTRWRIHLHCAHIHFRAHLIGETSIIIKFS